MSRSTVDRKPTRYNFSKVGLPHIETINANTDVRTDFENSPGQLIANGPLSCSRISPAHCGPSLSPAALSDSSTEDTKGLLSSDWNSRDVFNCEPSKVIKGDIIGSGSCATVYRALNICTGQVVLNILDCCEENEPQIDGQVMALKEVRLNHFQQTGEHILELEKEIHCLKNLTHKNIIHYLGSWRRDDSLYIAMELATAGSLLSLLKSFGPFQPCLIRIYARQIIDGLAYLHTQV